MGFFLKKGLKSRIPGPRGGCFYINPSRRGPVPGQDLPETSRRVKSLQAAAALEREVQ